MDTRLPTQDFLFTAGSANVLNRYGNAVANSSTCHAMTARSVRTPVNGFDIAMSALTKNTISAQRNPAIAPNLDMTASASQLDTDTKYQQYGGLQRQQSDSILNQQKPDRSKMASQIQMSSGATTRNGLMQKKFFLNTQKQNVVGNTILSKASANHNESIQQFQKQAPVYMKASGGGQGIRSARRQDQSSTMMSVNSEKSEDNHGIKIVTAVEEKSQSDNVISNYFDDQFNKVGKTSFASTGKSMLQKSLASCMAILLAMNAQHAMPAYASIAPMDLQRGDEFQMIQPNYISDDNFRKIQEQVDIVAKDFNKYQSADGVEMKASQLFMDKIIKMKQKKNMIDENVPLKYIKVNGDYGNQQLLPDNSQINKSIFPSQQNLIIQDNTNQKQQRLGDFPPQEKLLMEINPLPIMSPFLFEFSRYITIMAQNANGGGALAAVVLPFAV